MPVSRRFAYLLMLLVSGPTLSVVQAKSPTFAPKIDCDTGGCAHSVAIGDPYCDAADQNGDGIVDPLDSGLILARLGDCP